MCFDCLLAFPPFSSSPNVGAKKALGKLSRANTPAPDNDAYGPPLVYALNQEDLPDTDRDIKVPPDDIGETDSGTYVEHAGTDSEGGSTAGSMMNTEMEMNLVDGTTATIKTDEKFVYEQDVEFETSLDTELQVSDQTSGTTNGETIPPVNTGKKPETTLTDGGGEKDLPTTGKTVANLEVRLEYEEADGRLKVSVMKAIGVSTKDKGGFKNYRVRLSLRPNKVQSSKTRIRPADAPEFRELFRFQQLPKSDLAISELVFKLHGISGKFGKEKLVGSATLNLIAMKASAKQSFLIPLSAKT